MADKYVLDVNGNSKEEPDVVKWGKWFETAERHISNTKIVDVTVSTIFLGLDYNFGRGKPILWKTMIFGGEHDGYQERYCTKDEALIGHEKAVGLVKEGN